MKNSLSPIHLLLKILLSASLMVAFGCNALEDIDEEYEDTSRPARNAPAPVSQPPAAGADQAEWLVLFYMVADDEILEKDIFTDLNEAERVGSTANMHLVAQIDRYKGGFDGDGDWTNTRRYYLTQDADLTRTDSVLLEDMGELNMADGATLVDFVVWGIEEFPARKVALILSGHGLGWPGGFSDPDPGGIGEHDLALAHDFDNNLWMMELDEALGEILTQTGLDRFELVGFDACLMAGIEVFTALEPHARYAVASQEVEPGLGWAYASFLIDLAFDPGKNGAGLAQSIVDTYIIRDEVVTDDSARREYVQENFSVTRASAQEVADELSVDITLSAIDLAAMPALVGALDEVVYAMAATDQDIYAEIRAYTQSFENPLDEELPPPYIDLGHFISILLDEDISPKLNQAGQALLRALDLAVVAEKHGPDRPGASGISIYFPVFDLYDSYENLGYNEIALRFTADSQWDEYLDYHFTNEPPAGWDDVDAWVVMDDWLYEDDGSAGRAGSEPLWVDPLWLSDEVASLDAPVTIETMVSGSQLAYIYIFMGILSDDESILYIDDIDYLEAGAVREVNGVYFPDWEGETVEISYDFEPIIYAITDGVNTVPALLTPEEYGLESSVYSVEGLYRMANSQEERFAKLYFRDGEMFKGVAFSSTSGTGAPYALTPRQGDSFTVLRQGIYLDEAREGEYRAPAGTLVFGSANFTWVELPAPPGWYVVGIIAENFNGRQYEQYETVEVLE